MINNNSKRIKKNNNLNDQRLFRDTDGSQNLSQMRSLDKI